MRSRWRVLVLAPVIWACCVLTPAAARAGQGPGGSAPSANAALTCDRKSAVAKAAWPLDAHGDLANVFHAERTDLADTWCRIWEVTGAEKRFKAGDFARVLFTGDGVHPALAGSLVPGSGLAAGGSFQVGQHLTNVRVSEQAKALVATNGSRAFAGRVDMLGNESRADNHHNNATIVAAYQQLAKLTDYGPGNDTHATDASTFALRRTVVGGIVEVPVTPTLFVSVQASGLSLRPSAFDGVAFAPSASDPLGSRTQGQRTFDNASAYVVYGGGLRMTYPADAVTTGYTTELGGVFRQFQGLNDNSSSFGRADLAWTNWYTPSVAVGTFSVATLATLAVVPKGHAMPLGLQPTLGGTDMTGLQLLRSFNDYRFRAANRFGLSVEHEHELIGPLASLVFADWGGVATELSDVDFKRFHHSVGAGVSVRVGAVTVFRAFYAFGGGEGTRTTFTGASDALASTLNTRTLF